VAKSHSGGARRIEIAQNVVESLNKKEKIGNMYSVTIFYANESLKGKIRKYVWRHHF